MATPELTGSDIYYIESLNRQRGFGTVKNAGGTWDILIDGQHWPDAAGLPISTGHLTKTDALSYVQEHFTSGLGGQAHTLNKLCRDLKQIGCFVKWIDGGWQLQSQSRKSPVFTTLDSLKRASVAFLEQEREEIIVPQIRSCGVPDDLGTSGLDRFECSTESEERARTMLQSYLANAHRGWFLLFGSPAARRLAAAALATNIRNGKMARYLSLFEAVSFFAYHPDATTVAHAGGLPMGKDELLVVDMTDVVPSVNSPVERRLSEIATLLLRPMIANTIKRMHRQGATIFVSDADEQALRHLLEPQVFATMRERCHYDIIAIS